MNKNWKFTPKKLQLKNAEKELKTKNAELMLEMKLANKKENSEVTHWNHVLAKLNFPRNAKKNSVLQEDVQEFTTDVQEDVWEEHADLVLELNAQTKKGEKGCRRKHARRCRKLHLRRERKDKKVVVVEKVNTQEHQLNKEVKQEIQKNKTLPTAVMKSYCKERATQQCGAGKDNKLCRQRVKEEIKTQEIIFRMSAIQSCQCDLAHIDFHEENKSDIAQTCVNTCLTNACNIRSTYECQPHKDQVTCYKDANERCLSLHINQDN